MTKTLNRTSLIKNVTIYSAYLVIIWAFYRFIFQLPDGITELVIKPILWLLPICYFVFQRERMSLASIGFTFKNLFPAIYYSIALGAVFVLEAVFVNSLKYGGLNFGANIGSLPIMSSLGLSFATAFSEETAFRGYIFARLWLALKNEWTANVISTVLWTLVHVPIAFFVMNLNTSAAIIYLVLTAIFGLGSSFIFAKTQNIFGSIFLHVLWEWPIILFR